MQCLRLGSAVCFCYPSLSRTLGLAPCSCGLLTESTMPHAIIYFQKNQTNLILLLLNRDSYEATTNSR
jgi:hypothetical protein